MLTIKLLASLLAASGPSNETIDQTLEAQETADVVMMKDLAGTTHVLADGRQALLITSGHQIRQFGTDGSITVTETDGRVWKL